MSVRLGPYINAVVPRVVLRQATRLVVGLGRELHEALVHTHPIPKRRRQLVRVLLHDEVAGGWYRYETCHDRSLQSDGRAALFNAAHPVRGPSKEELPMDSDINVITRCCADADEDVHRVLTTKLFARMAGDRRACAHQGGRTHMNPSTSRRSEPGCVPFHIG